MYGTEDYKKLWYLIDYNRFCDEEGVIIHNIHEFLDPWQINDILKINKPCYRTINRVGVPIIVYITTSLAICGMEELMCYFHNGEYHDCNTIFY